MVRLRKVASLAVMFLFPLLSFANEQIAPELVSLRAAYQKAVHLARVPVTKSYIGELGEIQRALIASGNIEVATALLEERTRLQKLVDSGSLFYPGEVPPESSKEPPLEQTREMPAASKGEFHLEGTTWSWFEPRGTISFGANGEAAFQIEGDAPFRPVFTWKRKASREFLVTDFSNKGRNYRVIISPDGMSGSSLGSDSNASAEIELLSPRP